MRQHYGDCGYPDIRGEAKPYVAGSISQKTEEDPHPKPGFAMSGNRGEEQRAEQCSQSSRCHQQAHTQHGAALRIDSMPAHRELTLPDRCEQDQTWIDDHLSCMITHARGLV